MMNFTKTKVQEDNRPVWFVAFPVFKYNEDVKDIARKKNLRIVDSKFAASYDPKRKVKDAPKLTFKPEYEAKKA